MKQGWTITILLVDAPVRPEDPLDRKDMDNIANELLKHLPAGLTFQRFYVYKHKARLK